MFGFAKGIPPHNLRHTSDYYSLADSNNELLALADSLGLSNINTTRIYARL